MKLGELNGEGKLVVDADRVASLSETPYLDLAISSEINLSDCQMRAEGWAWANMSPAQTWSVISARKEAFEKDPRKVNAIIDELKRKHNKTNW